MPGEMVFLYEDVSGDPYRIIPTDGRAHRKGANPSYYGDSVAHWEEDTLVVDVTNFLENGWFGEGGYFHTDAMHVTERLWRDGENLIWQAAGGRSEGACGALDHAASSDYAVRRSS